MAGGKSRTQAREIQQILTTAEEKTLVRWITRYTIAGNPIIPALLTELAQLLRDQRVRFISSTTPRIENSISVGHEWLYRFLNRYSIIQGIYARQLEHARFDRATHEKIKLWFEAVADKIKEHFYKYTNIWNINESRFGVGESQTTRVLIHIDCKQKNKIVAGKQK